MDITDLKSFEGKYLSSLDSYLISPVTKWLNPRLISIDNKKMECEFEIRPDMADAISLLHGGIRAAMLSDVLGIFANFQQKDKLLAITTSMNIDFIGKSYVGEKVTVVSEVVNKGSSLIYMSGIIFNERKQIVAKGSTSLFVLNRK
ncbi:MAG: PaaI family thioesterase [Smithella sp.]